jgi:hypothetical protein
VTDDATLDADRMSGEADASGSGAVDALARLDELRQALAGCDRVEELKAIHDRAAALHAAARRAARNTEAARKARAIQLRAARRAGELLAGLQRDEGGRPSKETAATAATVSEYRKALSDARIPQRTATRWQELAAVPSDLFESELSGGKASERSIIAKAKPEPEPDPASTERGSYTVELQMNRESPQQTTVAFVRVDENARKGKDALAQIDAYYDRLIALVLEPIGMTLNLAEKMTARDAAEVFTGRTDDAKVLLDNVTDVIAWLEELRDELVTLATTPDDEFEDDEQKPETEEEPKE